MDIKARKAGTLLRLGRKFFICEKAEKECIGCSFYNPKVKLCTASSKEYSEIGKCWNIEFDITGQYIYTDIVILKRISLIKYLFLKIKNIFKENKCK